MSLLPPSALFQPANLNQAAAILFFIENSEKMSQNWFELRDLYLDNLLNIFKQVHLNNPIRVITLESSPLANEVPQQYSSAHEGLRNIRFNFDTSNRLSTGKIENAVNLLGSFKFKGQPVSSHLIIVAASTPEQEILPGIQQYSWFLVSEKLSQLNIYCHLALVQSGEDLSSFGGLFEKTLWLGGGVEVNPPFQVDSSKFVFRLAGARQQPPKQQAQVQQVTEDASNRPKTPIWTSQIQSDFRALQIIPPSTSPPLVQQSLGETSSTGHQSVRSSGDQREASQSSTSSDPDWQAEVPHRGEPSYRSAFKTDWPSVSGVSLTHQRSRPLSSIIGDRDQAEDAFFSNRSGATTSASLSSSPPPLNTEESYSLSFDTSTTSGEDSLPGQEGSALDDGDNGTNDEPFLLEAQAMVDAEERYKQSPTL